MSVGSYGSNVCTSCGPENDPPQSVDALYAIASTVEWLRTSANWVGHVDVPVAGHGDVRELDVVHRLAQLHRTREGLPVVRRADEVDARVEPVGRVAGEPRPREVDVAVTGTARAV